MYVQVGELYLEYLKGDYHKTNKTLCSFCTKLPCSAPGLERCQILKFYQLYYLLFDKTPIFTSTGSQREVDDYQSRA